jgi:phosphoribosylaminoimidazole (AIR) synthetase
MLSTFNCGIGMALIISKKDLVKTQRFFKNKKEEFFIIGQIIKSKKNEARCIIK